jgi:branched-chain amino acid transport system ATP-binding protein
MSLLEVRDVTKRFAGLVALRDVGFDVVDGEIFGIAGPNGAGKSVLFTTIAGFYRPTAGSIGFDGRSIVGLSPHEICRRGLVRTFQTPALFHSLTIEQNVQVGATFGAQRTTRITEILDFLDLGLLASRPATNLDLYTTKKVALASALATDCRLLLLDEPMAGFSHVEIESFLGLVRRIRHELGITIMIIEHLLDVLIGISDRMMVLHYGEVLYVGSPEDVKQDRQVVDVYLGGASES